MNILVLNGSAREKGHTAFLAQAFAEGAREEGANVTILTLGAKHVQGCLNCGWCRGEGQGHCIQKDDMEEIYPLIQSAEVIVFASPIYYFMLSGQMESCLQRTYAIDVPKKLKSCYLLMSSGSDGVYDFAKGQMEVTARYWGVSLKGILTAHGAQNGSSAKASEAKELGKRAARDSRS